MRRSRLLRIPAPANADRQRLRDLLAAHYHAERLADAYHALVTLLAVLGSAFVPLAFSPGLAPERARRILAAVFAGLAVVTAGLRALEAFWQHRRTRLAAFDDEPRP